MQLASLTAGSWFKIIIKPRISQIYTKVEELGNTTLYSFNYLVRYVWRF